MIWKNFGSRVLAAENFSSCPNGSRWIWDVFNECAQDGWDVASVVLGLSSIVCFIAAAFPQYVKACRTGNMDQAISIWFLMGWLGGDSCNLIGSFLANQLPLQRSLISAPINTAFLFISFGAVSASPLLLQLSPSAPQEVFRSRTLLYTEPTDQPFTKQEIIGFTIGSISSVLYLTSRLPQIYTNFQRKSTQGISYSLFALVILGNTTYGLSVLLKNPESGQSESNFLLHHLPWLIGSLGVLLLDIIISIQFFIYRQQPFSPEREPLLGQHPS
ncbi:lysosomal amino acid transporter 1 homolog isoform X2 [Dromiciops gliroides]|uniref:lysosomal amino acid transporter 1 homolog isoform X2 n=1 Tax=Dromiciops gliroides TaxID=33562 RepID=UPI001CC4691C|nr:lysosomal amino acid transporter 1 homolog isoform X2 [Dromiciops gliroides]